MFSLSLEYRCLDTFDHKLIMFNRVFNMFKRVFLKHNNLPMDNTFTLTLDACKLGANRHWLTIHLMSGHNVSNVFWPTFQQPRCIMLS